MEWQETVALLVVAVTATVFGLRSLKSRKGGLPCDSGCGCSSGSDPDQKQPSTVLQARKGQRARLRIKT